jgi:hypothetical protein
VRCLLIVALLLAGSPAWAQQTPPAPPPPVDSPGEIDKLKDSCGSLKVAGCATELLTGQPLHIAIGSIAPQNGFAAGLAYVGHMTPTNWRINWNADAVGSASAWRAGVYLKLVDTREALVGHHFGTQGDAAKPNLTELPEHPVISIYAQTISLDKIDYFGVGPATTLADSAFFGMRQTIVGGSALKPVWQQLHGSLYGEINGRFVSLRAGRGASPSIEQRFTDATAPGLLGQPAFAQLGEGLRIRPVLAADVIRLNYDVALRHYLATSNSKFTFHRLTVDLSHEFALYRQTTRVLLPRDANGPDECSVMTDPKHPECESITRDLEGRAGVRFFLSESITAAGHAVPFYFQPTLGGSDINGDTVLGSYQDYRFRAPNVMFVRESIEHSILGPVGVTVLADEGKVALTRGGLRSGPWLHSWSAGLTVRAGGFPVVSVLYSQGGTEGHHSSILVNTSLLGGSARPSLF